MVVVQNIKTMFMQWKRQPEIILTSLEEKIKKKY